MKEYKGIEIEGLGKPVRKAHSRFFETSEGLDYFEKLIDRDKRGAHARAVRSGEPLEFRREHGVSDL